LSQERPLSSKIEAQPKVNTSGAGLRLGRRLLADAVTSSSESAAKSRTERALAAILMDFLQDGAQITAFVAGMNSFQTSRPSLL
jgi:hypothetical protein